MSKNSKNLNINNLNCHGLFLLFIFKDEAANKIILSQGHTHDWCISCNHSGLCNSLLQGLSLFSSLQETALDPLLLTGTCHHTVWWHHFPNLSCLPQLFFNHHMNTHTHYCVPSHSAINILMHSCLAVPGNFTLNTLPLLFLEALLIFKVLSRLCCIHAPSLTTLALRHFS